jgi:outer membrane protein
MMVKERFAEVYGPPLHTIGSGGSGGAMQQLLIAGAYPGIINGISQVKAQRQAVISTRTALEAAQTGFEVGTRTIVQVLDSQREHLRAQRNHARARYDYLLNTLRLKQAAGTLSEQDIVAINRWLSEGGS